MIRGALATGGTGGATQPRQEYAAAGQGECKDMGEQQPPAPGNYLCLEAPGGTGRLGSLMAPQEYGLSGCPRTGPEGGGPA